MNILAILPMLFIVAIGLLLTSIVVLYEFSKALRRLARDDEEDD